MTTSTLPRAAPRPSGLNTPAVSVVEHLAAWNAYVSAHPRATFYHRFEWLGLIARVFGHRVFPVAATAHGHIVGVLPLVLMDSRLFGRFMVSLPFVNYGGVLGDSEEIERRLWEHGVALAMRHKAGHLEARHLAPHGFVPQGKQHKVTMVLSLAPSVEAQWKGFDGKLRNQVRKAELAGLSVTIGGASEVGAFYEVFARNMRDLGTPVYPRRLFETVVQTFPDAFRVCTVRHGRQVVAAALALAHRGTLEVPWAASRRDALSRCPNQRLYWELIQHAIKAGYTRFDFGRSTPGSGPYKFKQQWGAEEVPLYWEYWTADGVLPDLQPHNPRYALAVRLWKRLPLALANRLGPAIVRNIP
ncbi:FemAB family XrtA/PEP-CTERM system-associated protein [Candidatus Nitrospira bockiana]